METCVGDKGNEADKFFKREHAHGLRQTPRKQVGQPHHWHVRRGGRARAAAAQTALGRLRREPDVSIINVSRKFNC